MRRTPLPLVITLTSLAVLPPVARAAAIRAVVTVTAPGSSDGPSLGAVKTLVEDALGRQRIGVLRQPVLAAEAPAAARRAFCKAHGVDRIYEVSLLPMGRKQLVRLGERDAASDRLTHSATLSARSIEELDLVLPRLVKSVVERVAVEQTQQIDTVTAAEGRKLNKKAGELLLGGSVIAATALHARMAGPLYGGEFNMAYEMPHVRLSWDTGGAGAEDVPGHFYSGIRAFYLLSTGSITPFFGGGMGFLLISDGEGRDDVRWEARAGMALSASAGVELFRMHQVRLIAELEARFPLFTLDRRVYDVGTGGGAGESGTDWAPIGLFKLTLLFGRK